MALSREAALESLTGLCLKGLDKLRYSTADVCRPSMRQNHFLNPTFGFFFLFIFQRVRRLLLR
ncbi:MAG TPA: hypothetical protein DCW60_04165 [Sutterella sp.]|nr:hypothetical protein [Sutterella sp.]